MKRINTIRFLVIAVLFSVLPLLSFSQYTDCLNFSDLNQSSVTCHYGTAANPLLNTGLSAADFKVISDPSFTDEILGTLLHGVPSGFSHSVRMGSLNGANTGRNVEYTMQVNENNKLLFLSYAMLLKSDGSIHPNQNYIKLEITGLNDQVLNATCGTVTYIAGQEGTWSPFASGGSQYTWKDWTTTGIDLSTYVGQTVRIKVYHVQEPALGYVYYTLGCGDKLLLAQDNCGMNGDITLSAPVGYQYKWYESTHPTVILSAEQSIEVQANDKTYVCECTSKINAACSFSLSHVAAPMLTYSDFDYAQVCNPAQFNNYLVTFQNKSEVTVNGIPSTTQKPNEYHWIFHDGTTSDEENPTKYYTEGNYAVTLISGLKGLACKDTLRSSLYVMDNSVGELITAYICPGSSYRLGDKEYTRQGVYLDTVKNPDGCDSIIMLRLRISPTYTRNVTATICDKEVYTLNGKPFTRAGYYSDTLKTKMGCDSIFNLTLKVNPSYSTDVYATICDSTEYIMNGKSFKKQGIHSDTLRTQNGCDSIFVLHLTVNPVYTLTYPVTICKGETYAFHGKTFTSAGIYRDTLQSSTGCDSISILELRISSPPVQHLNATICRGEDFLVGNISHTTTGLYTDTLKTINGCDSVVILDLLVNPSASKSITAVICRGEVFEMNGKSYSSTGTYRDTLKTVNGCDSIFVLSLTVNPTYLQRPKVSICNNQSYMQNGRLLTTAGVYTDSMKSKNGCDSTVILTLVIKPEVTYTVQARQDSSTGLGFISFHNMPDSAHYSVNGVTNGEINNLTPGTYVVNAYNNIGCPGTPVSIDLSPCPELVVQATDVCLTPTQIKLATTPVRGTALSYSITFDDVAKAVGFEDVLDAPYSADTIIIPLPASATPKVYKATISFKSVFCNTMNMYLEIMIPYPSSILAQKWNDVIVIYNEQNNGGYLFTSYQWYKNGFPIPGQTNPYLQQKPRLDLNSLYSVLVTTTANDTVFSCPLKPQLTDDYFVYPTFVDRTQGVYQIKMISPYAGTARIWDSGGILKKSHSISKGMNLIDIQTLITGIYILELRTENDSKTYSIVIK